MGLENGIIRAPFNTATVSRAIGKASGDVATLCMAGEPYINKWSKHKPIRYDTPEELTEEQYKGNSIDRRNGYYYGINCITSAMIENVHNNTYDYLVPDINTFKRLTDFNNYNQNGTINFFGYMPNELYYELDSAKSQLTCTLDTNIYTDSTLISIDDLLSAMPNSGVSNINDCYLCIMIGTYTRVMRIGSAFGTISKIGDAGNGIKWYVDMTTFPNNNIDTLKPVTLYVTDKYKNTNLNYDFTNWTDIFGQRIASGVVSVPNAVNMTITRSYFFISNVIIYLYPLSVLALGIGITIKNTNRVSAKLRIIPTCSNPDVNITTSYKDIDIIPVEAETTIIYLNSELGVNAYITGTFEFTFTIKEMMYYNGQYHESSNIIATQSITYTF